MCSNKLAQKRRKMFGWGQITQPFVVIVHLLNWVRLFVTPWTVARQASLSTINSWYLFKLTSFELMLPSNHLILCHPLLLPSIFASIRVFSRESVLRIRWPKYWSFNFSISPSNEYSRLIYFRIDWFDLFAIIQGTLKCLFQHHSSKASIFWCSVVYRPWKWVRLFFWLHWEAIEGICSKKP